METLALQNSNFHSRALILSLATVLSAVLLEAAGSLGESLTRLGSAPPWCITVLSASEHTLRGKLTVRTLGVSFLEMIFVVLQCTAEGLHAHFQFIMLNTEKTYTKGS